MGDLAERTVDILKRVRVDQSSHQNAGGSEGRFSRLLRDAV